MGPSDEVEVRLATLADAAAIATVHIHSWKQAYAGLVPEAYLNTLHLDEQTETWRRWLSTSATDQLTTLVASQGEQILGFVTVGPARDEDCTADQLEIYSIYIEPDTWGRGVARELLRSVISATGEHQPITLWVLAGSERALHFYRRNGFSPDGVERYRERSGARLLELRYRRG